MTFFKGFEQQELESHRGVVMNTMMTLIQKNFSCRIRRFLFSNILKNQRELNKSVTEFKMETAKAAFETLKEFLSIFVRISKYGSLSHLESHGNQRIQFLEDQLTLISNLESILTMRGVTMFDRLKGAQSEIRRLNISSHPTVAKCEVLLYKFDSAVQFLEDFNSMTGTMTQSMREMTADDMRRGVGLMEELKDVLPAEKVNSALAAATQRENQIRREVFMLPTLVINLFIIFPLNLIANKKWFIFLLY